MEDDVITFHQVSQSMRSTNEHLQHHRVPWMGSSSLGTPQQKPPVSQTIAVLSSRQMGSVMPQRSMEPCALQTISTNYSTSRCFVCASAFIYLFSVPSYLGYWKCK